MHSWSGSVKILNIENKPPVEEGAKVLPGFLPLESGAVAFNHYPDCQQLVIWLPRPGKEYGELRIRDAGTGESIESWPVGDKLSGAIQILWDTLYLPPGSYRIEIDHCESGKHIIDLIKYKEGEDIPDDTVPILQPETGHEPIVYRDGSGKIIVDEDLLLREKVLKDIADRFSRHIEYESSGRSGTVIYVEGETRVPFYYELGGGDCVAYIELPAAGKWESETKMPLERREDIIQFTAASVHSRQAPNCRVEISDEAIKYFHK